ncbi:MAG TPA: heme-binding protein [Verrucomicrobiae bacterium]|jgi:uncharacterized protein GlcG (DUF336 family)|nr:heme-binding protein [Verrucomicrobiae bacterium]
MSHIRFPVLAVGTLVLVGVFSMTALSQELLTEKAISVDMAQAMAQAALAQCRANGYRVTATVLDSGGNLKVVIRDDGAALVTVDLSHRKAYSAVAFRRTSGETAKAFGAMSPPPNVAGTVMLAGGVPIKVGNDTIGAIGVSGAPGGDKDEACANAGIAKVADKLK